MKKKGEYFSDCHSANIDLKRLLNPDSDRIDGMTYARIVKGASIDNLRTTGVSGNYFGFSGIGVSILAQQNDL